MALSFSTPLFHLDAQLSQFRADFVWIGGVPIAFVDGDQEGDFGGLSMADGLFGLRHHGIVCGHNDDGQVGDLSTAGTHGCKRFVTRGVDERHSGLILQFHTV